MSENKNSTAKIGMIGLGVMGQNLTLNIERNGYPIAVYDRDPQETDAFVSQHRGKKIVPTHSPEEFVRSLEKPRKIILLVKAGDPVDWTINLINPFSITATSSLMAGTPISLIRSGVRKH